MKHYQALRSQALLHCEIGDEDGDDDRRNYPFDDEVNRAGDFLYNLRLFESPTYEDRKEQTAEGHQEIRSQTVAEIEKPGGHAAQGAENPAEAEDKSCGLPSAHFLLVYVKSHSSFQHRY